MKVSNKHTHKKGVPYEQYTTFQRNWHPQAGKDSAKFVIDETFFPKLVNKKGKNQYRNQKLLEIAKGLMPPI
jgi:hypothetical protein